MGPPARELMPRAFQRVDSAPAASVHCRAMKKPRARTTLGDLQRSSPWVWVNCEKCQHHAPWPSSAGDQPRQCARCTVCGPKGATIQHPGCGGERIGFLPFPTPRASPIANDGP